MASLHDTRVLVSWFDGGDANGVCRFIQRSGDLDVLTLELLGSVLIIEDVSGLGYAVLQHEFSTRLGNLASERLHVRHLTHGVMLLLLLLSR